MEHISKQEHTDHGEPQQSPSHGQTDTRTAKQGPPTERHPRLRLGDGRQPPLQDAVRRRA